VHYRPIFDLFQFLTYKWVHRSMFLHKHSRSCDSTHHRYQVLNVAPVFFLLLIVLRPISADAIDSPTAVRLAREYLHSGGLAKKRKLAKQLAGYHGDLRAVVTALQPQTFDAVRPGYYPHQHFSIPKLRRKRPADLLYMIVPNGYDAQKATGLIVFMHGGGNDSPRTAPDGYFKTTKTGGKSSETALGDLFLRSGMIAVAPSAPWNPETHERWCVKEADEYLADVILECKQRFHIDANRVFLIGHSMGGYGAYHQVQRQPDRFAAVVASAGAWWFAYWPVIRGTILWIVHGTRDAQPSVRPHNTDIAYAHAARKLLDEHGIEYVYKQHDGGHDIEYSLSGIESFLASTHELKRDPCYPHVVLASPIGYRNEAMYCFPVRHNRWLTLEQSVKEKLVYDELWPKGLRTDFETWMLEHSPREIDAAMIDALNEGNNRFRITVRNVTQFVVWLRPEMVEFGKPVEVIVNGKVRFHDRVSPSLATLLESYERRQDWGLTYPSKIEISVPGPDAN
jgi:predicted esterase